MIRKGADAPFLLAVAAALFLAVACYVGAALFALAGSLAAQPLSAQEPRETALSGLALRHETVLDAPLEAPDGARVRGRGVYFAACDGYEGLDVSLWETLDARGLAALLDAPPQKAGAARLVTGTDWYYAALLREGDCPAPGPCRLRFSGFARAVDARIVDLRESAGETLLLFRLTEGGAYLKERILNAEIERG